MMKHGFTILKMETANPERRDIRVDRFRAAHQAQQNVRCHIIAQRNGQPQKLAQGHIDPGIGILLLQRTVESVSRLGPAPDLIGSSVPGSVGRWSLAQFRLLSVSVFRGVASS